MRRNLAKFAGALALAAIPFFSINESSAEEKPVDQGPLQLGLHLMAPINLESPFIDLSRTGRTRWALKMTDGSTMDFPEALAAGYIDPATGLPSHIPSGGKSWRGSAFFTNTNRFRPFYQGEYILDWEGDAFGFMSGGKRRDIIKRTDNSVTFNLPANANQIRTLAFNRFGEDGLKNFRLYRKEHKALLDAGEIWAPEFLDHVRKYDIIRTMDTQSTNGSPIRSFADVAKVDDVFWGNKINHKWPQFQRYGIPYEVLFDLATKADASLWLHIPPMIGAPHHMASPALYSEKRKKGIGAGSLRAMGRKNTATILESPEWEIFAREFVDRLVASGYPQDKPLYVELGNEVWNFVLPFIYHTNYAHGVGMGINEKWNYRHGYGVLSARWVSALEAELISRDLDYNITYVLAGQTAWAGTTRLAMMGFRHYVKSVGGDIESLLPKIGIALTTYSSCFKPFSKERFGGASGPEIRKAWEEAIEADPEGLKKAYRDYCVDGPASAASTRAWVVKKWREHAAIAERQGVRIIGAYEGGSHDVPDRSVAKGAPVFRNWWKDYHWGPYGADVVRQVNLAVRAEFPDAILSNYASIGPISLGGPWIDGHYSTPTDMSRMWEEFSNR